MAFIWCDPIASWVGLGNNTAPPASVAGSVGFFSQGSSLVIVPGPFGYGCSLQQEGYWGFPSNVTTGFLQFRLNWNAVGSADLIFLDLTSGSAIGQCELTISSTTGGISIKDATGTVVASSAPGVFNPSSWTVFQVKIVIGTTSFGSIQVYLNGSTTPAVQALGINTKNTANAYFNGFGSVAGSYHYGICDMVLCDASGGAPFNTFLPAGMQLQFQTPTGAGHTTQWTPNGAATNWQAASNGSYSGATYVSDSNVSDVDLYTLSALQGSISTIIGTQAIISGSLSAAGTRSVAPVVRSGSTQSADAATALTASIGILSRAFRTVDPNTGSAWTLSSVNALQVGPEVTV